MEEWKTIPGYEGLYEVSSYGRVRSVDRYVKYLNGMIHLHKGKVLSPGIRSDGYLQVSLCCNGKYKTISVHRLIAQTFLPNPDNLPMINHKDEDKTNNNVDNLEWCTAKYNSNYGTSIERAINTKIKNGYCTKEFCFLDSKERQKLYNKQYQQEHKEELKEYRNKNKEHYKELNRKYMREYRKRKRGQ